MLVITLLLLTTSKVNFIINLGCIEVSHSALLQPDLVCVVFVINDLLFCISQRQHVPHVELGLWTKSFHMEFSIHVIKHVVLPANAFDMGKWPLDGYQLSINFYFRFFRIHIQQIVRIASAFVIGLKLRQIHHIRQ